MLKSEHFEKFKKFVSLQGTNNEFSKRQLIQDQNILFEGKCLPYSGGGKKNPVELRFSFFIFQSYDPLS